MEIQRVEKYFVALLLDEIVLKRLAKVLKIFR